MQVQPILQDVLIVLGVGFLVADVRLAIDYLRFQRRHRDALLVWPAPTPPYYRLALAIGVALGLLIFYKLVVLRTQVFGEAMMFLYYAYMLPLSRRIRRGFYGEGIWTDGGFLPYQEIGGISWREGEHQVALILISRLRNLARRLTVPGDRYGAARRILRDKIATHEIHFTGTGLDLEQHDERDEA